MDIEDEQDKEKVGTKLTLCVVTAFMFKDWFLRFEQCKVLTLKSSLPHECTRKVMSGSPGLVYFIG